MTGTQPVRGNVGHWTVLLKLTPGRYEHKFVVDGEWCCEPGCTALNVECPHCYIKTVPFEAPAASYGASKDRQIVPISLNAWISEWPFECFRTNRITREFEPSMT